jgi:hypothetical protein
MAKVKAATVPSMEKSEAEWRAEDDMRTLLRAKEVESDPKRLAAARACAKKKLSEMQSVAAAAPAAAKKD